MNGAAMHGLIDAVGWTLVHFLWQGMAAGVATSLALAALRGARPQLRYLVACAGLLACVLWPLLALAWRLQDGAAALPGKALYGPDVGKVEGAVAALQQHMGWIVCAWAACCAALAGRTALGLAWVARAARTGGRDAYWQTHVDRLAAAMGVARRVRLRIVDHIAGPVTAGCWRPVVLVPASLLSGMPPELLQALLAHEMAHIRRHDYLVNLLQNLAEILLFYHPAVWWISRRIRVERELIADGIAARHAGGPRQLALALSELEKNQFAHPEPALAANGGDLMNRIAHLLHPAPRRGLATVLTHVLAGALPALALAGICLAGMANADVVVARPDRQPFIDFKTCAKPAWPQASLAAKETGTVTLEFLVEADGRVTDTRVLRTSGHDALDEAARTGIRQCVFQPGQVASKPVKSWVKMQYVWTLE